MNLFELSMLRIIRKIIDDNPNLVGHHNLAGTEAMYYLCYWNITKKYNPARIIDDYVGSYYVLVNQEKDIIDITQRAIIYTSVNTMPFPTQKPSKEAMKIINKVLEL